MAVTTEMIKQLREDTGAGVMDAKRALDESGGDMARAKEILREKGMAAAAKRSERETSQGVVEAYIHAGGRIGVLVEVNCETDFVANTPEFRQLAKDVAMQVAAMQPLVVDVEIAHPGHGRQRRRGRPPQRSRSSGMVRGLSETWSRIRLRRRAKISASLVSRASNWGAKPGRTSPCMVAIAARSSN